MEAASPSELPQEGAKPSSLVCPSLPRSPPLVRFEEHEDGFYDPAGDWHYWDDESEGDGDDGAGSGSGNVVHGRKTKMIEQAMKQGTNFRRPPPPRRNKLPPGGWKGAAADGSYVRPKPGFGRTTGYEAPPDVEARRAAFEISQMARVRWRRAIGAAKCIARMRSSGPDPNATAEDDDAQYEFRFKTTKAEIIDGHGR